MNDPLSKQVVELITTVDRTILAPNHGRVRSDALQHKGDASAVTTYDRDAERALSAGLRSITPGVDVVGEEEIDADPRAFRRITDSGALLIVDPIDGTGAFARGEKTYGIIVAFVNQGHTTRGFIYVPGRVRVNGEDVSGNDPLLVVATKEAGCVLNGERVSLLDRPRSLAGARVSFACRNQDKHFENILAAGVRGYLPRNNSAFDYASLLRGDRDAVFYSEGRMPDGEGKCPPWDHAAGVLAVQEAQGYVGLPYSSSSAPYAPLHRYKQLLVASSRELWIEMYDHVRSRVPQLCAHRDVD
jgi:fructose-1,6-bisphosphatase/inositol monophosphatase family enzyme